MQVNTRIPFPDEGGMTAEQERVHAAIADGPRGGVRGPLRLLLHSPDIAQLVQALGAGLRWNTSLSQSVTELVILLTARHLRADYVWNFHTEIVTRNGLFSAAALTEIAEGRLPEGLGAEERIAGLAAMELFDTHSISEDLLAKASETLGHRGLIELLSLAGYYHIGSFIASAAQLSLAENAASPEDGGRTSTDQK